MTPQDRRGNPDLLRHAIDSGRTGDKVNFPDPAAAPLGSDDEAAGTPPTARDVESSLSQETSNAPPADRPSTWPIWTMAGIIFITAVVIVAAAMLL